MAGKGMTDYSAFNDRWHELSLFGALTGPNQAAVPFLRETLILPGSRPDVAGQAFDEGIDHLAALTQK
jgi:hypothetical protein